MPLWNLLLLEPAGSDRWSGSGSLAVRRPATAMASARCPLPTPARGVCIAESLRTTSREAEYDARMKSQTIPTVRTYMDRDTHALSADDDILTALGRLIDEGVTGAPVVDDDGRVIGVLSELNCLRLLAEGSGGNRVSGAVRDFMATEFTVVPSNMDIYYVAGMFLGDPAHRRFIVIDQGQLVGVVTRKDILRAVRSGLSGG